MRARVNTLTQAIHWVLIGAMGLPLSQVSLAAGEFDQVTSIFAEADPTLDSVSPDQGVSRIPQRMQGRVVVRAPRPAPRIDASLQPAKEDLTQRRFSLDALPLLEGADVDPQHLAEVMAPWTQAPLSFVEFQLAAQTLLEHLRANGHPNAALRFSQMQLMANQQVAVAIEGLEPVQPYQDGTPRIWVAGFEVKGVTLLAQSEIDAQMSAWAGRELTLEELGEAAESLAQVLRNQGYGLAQAWLPPQEILDGRVQIEVLEGVVDGTSGQQGISVEGDENRLRHEVASRYLSAGVSPDQPLNLNALEKQVRVLNDLPGVKSVQTDLIPGSVPGTTQVIARVEEDSLITTSMLLDNYGSAFSGEERANLNLSLNSPLGYGEQFFLSLTAAEGSHSYKLGGHLPLGYSGLRLGASYAQMDVELIKGEVAPLNVSSDSEVFSLFANYPMWRAADRNLDLFASLDLKRYQNSILSGLIANDRRIHALSYGFSGDWIDAYRGRSGYALVMTHGDLDLSGNREYQLADAQSARTEGSFTKANFNLNRLQALPWDHWFVYGAFSGQLASGNLDSSEKFQLGGPLGVRAWPVGEAIGDHGWLANLELRRHLGQRGPASFEAFGFYDIGGIRQYADPNPQIGFSGPNDYTLAGFGAGLSMTYAENGNVRLVYAQKDGKNPNPATSADGRTSDSDGRNDSGRLWLIGTILF